MTNYYVLTNSEIHRLAQYCHLTLQGAILFDLLVYYFLTPDEIAQLTPRHFTWEGPRGTLTFNAHSQPVIPRLAGKLRVYFESCSPEAPCFDHAAVLQWLTAGYSSAQIAAAGPILINPPTMRFANLHHIEESAYQVILVVNSNELRYLITDYAIVGVIDPVRQGCHLLSYQAYAKVLPFTKPSRMLLLGGGAYILPRLFNQCYPNAQVDVCEIDPAMTRVAQVYGDLQTHPRRAIIHDDAYTVVRSTSHRYDFVFFDIPLLENEVLTHRLSQPDSLAQYRDLLTTDGIFEFNMLGYLEGPFSTPFRYLFDQLSQLFPKVLVYPVEGNAGTQLTQSQNICLFGFNNPNMTLSMAELPESIRAGLDTRYTPQPTLL